MKVTRTLHADVPAELTPICQAMGYLRADIWRRYGALGNIGRSALDIRKDIVTRNLYGGLPVDGTIRNETTKDVVNDLLTYKAAAKLKVRQAIAKKQQWKRYNRRMSGWAKGVLAEALDSVCEQRDAEHVLVNGAYTSQMDSTTGRLQGRRVGDKFYRVTGDVLQADHNAALNVLARLADPEIKRFTPYRDVKRLLLARSPAPLSVKRLELGGSPRQPSADKSI